MAPKANQRRNSERSDMERESNCPDPQRSWNAIGRCWRWLKKRIRICVSSLAAGANTNWRRRKKSRASKKPKPASTPAASQTSAVAPSTAITVLTSQDSTCGMARAISPAVRAQRKPTSRRGRMGRTKGPSRRNVARNEVSGVVPLILCVAGTVFPTSCFSPRC